MTILTPSPPREMTKRKIHRPDPRPLPIYHLSPPENYPTLYPSTKKIEFSSRNNTENGLQWSKACTSTITQEQNQNQSRKIKNVRAAVKRTKMENGSWLLGKKNRKSNIKRKLLKKEIHQFKNKLKGASNQFLERIRPSRKSHERSIQAIEKS